MNIILYAVTSGWWCSYSSHQESVSEVAAQRRQGQFSQSVHPSEPFCNHRSPLMARLSQGLVVAGIQKTSSSTSVFFCFVTWTLRNSWEGTTDWAVPEWCPTRLIFYFFWLNSPTYTTFKAWNNNIKAKQLNSKQSLKKSRCYSVIMTSHFLPFHFFLGLLVLFAAGKHRRNKVRTVELRGCFSYKTNRIKRACSGR